MKKSLSVFSLIMINVIAVASLRTLPFSAKLGLPLVFYYAVGALFFFIPVALVTAELATTWPKNGGIYVWVREALGGRVGLLVIWLQWVYNLVWYPTILSLIAGATAYLFDPALANNPMYMTCMVLGIFWLATLVNCFGMELSSLISTIGSIFGTLIPMLVIMGIGIYWVVTKQPTPINWEWSALIPQVHDINDLVLFNTILFGLLGLEMSAVHAQEVHNPEKNYPQALAVSGVIILVTLILSSVALAVILPPEDINIVVGPIQAFQAFFDELDMQWMLPIIVILIIIGAVSCIATWIVGPTKGLLIAAEDGNLPTWMTRTNKHNVPVAILFCQGVVVTVLALVYLLMPTAEGAYMVLTELTAILALLMYIMMFIAAIVLRYKFPKIHRPYRIPFGKAGMLIVATVGGLASLIAMVLGFVTPSQVNIGTTGLYQLILIIGTIVFCMPAFFISKCQDRHCEKVL